MAQGEPDPGDKARWGRFDQLAEFNQYTLRDILEQASKPTPARTPIERQVGRLLRRRAWTSRRSRRRALSPIRPDLDAIAVGVVEGGSRAACSGTLRANGVERAVQRSASSADFRDSTRTLMNVDQGGTTLPDRDYYLKDDAKNAETRDAVPRVHRVDVRSSPGTRRDGGRGSEGRARLRDAARGRAARPRVADATRRTATTATRGPASPRSRRASTSTRTSRPRTRRRSPTSTSAWPDFFKGLDAAWQQASLDDLKT